MGKKVLVFIAAFLFVFAGVGSLRAEEKQGAGKKALKGKVQVTTQASSAAAKKQGVVATSHALSKGESMVRYGGGEAVDEGVGGEAGNGNLQRPAPLPPSAPRSVAPAPRPLPPPRPPRPPQAAVVPHPPRAGAAAPAVVPRPPRPPVIPRPPQPPSRVGAAPIPRPPVPPTRPMGPARAPGAGKKSKAGKEGAATVNTAGTVEHAGGPALEQDRARKTQIQEQVELDKKKAERAQQKKASAAAANESSSEKTAGTKY
ncbi:MAG: hypothetical protein WCG78_06665 [Candidatus Omnitrophota bacterium]